MGKPIVYGIDPSPAVRAVLLVASAIDLDYEMKEVNTQKGEHKTEEYLKKNPQHTIPTLEDNGKCIWDSHAIIVYLVNKYGKDDSLYPKDLFTRAVIDQRLHFESGVLSPRMFAYGTALSTKNPEEMEKTRTSLLEAYEFMEKFLGNNQYFVGNSTTVADFSILASLSTVNAIFPVDQTKYPKLSDWLDRMTKLPYYEKANKEGLDKLLDFFQKMSQAGEKEVSENAS